MVPSLSKAAVAVGADGLLLEVHYRPEEALCDGKQSLSLTEFDLLMVELRNIVLAVGRRIA
jgi:3-deoxy-7-phosphoheptulonate synthase